MFLYSMGSIETNCGCLLRATENELGYYQSGPIQRCYGHSLEVQKNSDQSCFPVVLSCVSISEPLKAE